MSARIGVGLLGLDLLGDGSFAFGDGRLALVFLFLLVLRPGDRVGLVRAAVVAFRHGRGLLARVLRTRGLGLRLGVRLLAVGLDRARAEAHRGLGMDALSFVERGPADGSRSAGDEADPLRRRELNRSGLGKARGTEREIASDAG